MCPLGRVIGADAEPLVERRRLLDRFEAFERGVRVILPGLLAVAAILNLVLGDTSRLDGTMWLIPILAMVLHGLWDFSTFAASTVIGAYTVIAVGIAAVIVAIVLLRKEARAEKAVV